MSVATKNYFALLDDDQPSEPSPPPPQTDPTPAPVPPQNNNRSNRGRPAARGARYYPRGGKPRDADQPAEEPAADDSQRKFENVREGGRGRGRGGPGGRGGGRGRPYDKHSQTGRTDSDKKVHQGWGGDNGNAELKTEQAATVDVIAESGANEWGAETTPNADWAGTGGDTSAADAWGAPPADAAAGATDPWAPIDSAAANNDKPEGRPRRDREVEEEDNTLTLSQYQAQQKVKVSAIPKLENTRKANDGAGDDLWKDVVPRTKNEEEDAYFVGKSKSAHKARPKKEEKIYLEIEARFDRPDRGGRGRGQRGGDRGGDRRGSYAGGGGGGGRGGNGNPRGGRPNGSSNINIDDQAAFPSLA